MSVSVLVPASTPSATPCEVVQDDLWFSQRPRVVEQAKELCLSCPVMLTCLHDALERREPWGVWGGELVERGVVVARKRPMGRPTKHELALRQAETGRVGLVA